MFGARNVTAAAWTNGKKTITGCWEYSGVFDKFDIWLDSTGPDADNRLHVIVDAKSADDGSSARGPEWGPWKLVKPEQKTVDKDAESGKTGT